MVGLEIEDESVNNAVRECTCIRGYGLCEAEFAWYAKETLFSQEPAVSD